PHPLLRASVVAGTFEGLVLCLATRLFQKPPDALEAYTCLVPPFFILVSAVAGTIYRRLALGHDAIGELSWWNTASAWLFLLSTWFSVLNILVFFGPKVILTLSVSTQTILFVVGLASCGIFAMLGYRSSLTASRKKAAFQSITRGSLLVMCGGIAL